MTARRDQPTKASHGYPTDRLLTTEDVATYLQVTVTTVAKMIRTGELPAQMIARCWGIRPADLAAFLDAAPSNELARELNGYQ